MADKQDRKIVTRRGGGFFYDLTSRAKLIGRLMMDSRVNPFIKVLPLASLGYLLFPDIPGPIDDALIMWLGTYLFVELCPPDVVQEHMQSFESGATSQWKDGGPRDEIIDGQYYEQGTAQDPNRQRDPSQRP